MIYLDYAAATPVDASVMNRFIRTEVEFPGNPNSLHAAGAASRAELDRITASVASLLGTDKSEIIFTSGASEANNTAINGIAYASRNSGKHIISTALEHSSVSAALTALVARGYEVDLVRIGRDGKIDLDELRSLIRPDTILAAFSAVDSELGVIQPIHAIRTLLQDYPNCRLHVDVTQTVGKIPFSLADADTASLSAHKFYGIAGSGLLYKRKGIALEPLIYGGSDFTLYRGGTPTVALNASLEEALRRANEEQAKRYAVVETLNHRVRAALSTYAALRFNSPDDAVPHLLNLSVDGVKSSDFRDALSRQGVCVSVKSACSTDSLPSRAVMAVSRNRANALASWRISLSHRTTEDEISQFLEIFDTCYRELKK